MDDQDRSRLAAVGGIRARLLDEARRIVREEGLGALSVRTVAAACGVSPPTINYHYRSKEGLLAALAAEGFAQLAEAMRAAVEAGRHPSRMRTATLAYIRFAVAEPELYRLMNETRDRAPRGDTAPAEARAFQVLSEAVLHDADGQYAEADTSNATVAIWAAARGIAALALAPAAAGDDAQAQAVKQAVRGLEFLMGPRRPGGEARESGAR